MVNTLGDSGVIISNRYTNLVTFDESEDGIIPIQKNSSIKTKDFMDRIARKFTSTPQDYIYPKNTRFVKKINSVDLFVIEWEPSIRTIKVERDMFLEYDEIQKAGKGEIIREGDYNTNDNIQKFTLSFPYLVWIVTVKYNMIHNLKLYFRLSPLTSLNDLLILPPLLNISMGKHNSVRTVCMGGLNEHENSGDLIGVEDNLSLFFRNKFNNDYPDMYSLYRDFEESTMSNYFLWQHMTRKDPLFIFRDKWKVTSKTLKDELESSIKDTGIYNNHYSLSFPDITNMTESDEELGISDDDKKPLTFIKSNSIFEEISIGDHILTIGDDLKLDNTLYYLNSVIFNDKNNDILLELEDEEENFKDVKLTNKIKESLREYFDFTKNRGTRLNEIVNNGNKIRIGDFVNVKGRDKSFRRVSEIVQSQDGFNELVLEGSISTRITNYLEVEKFTYKKLCEILGGKVRKGSTIEYYLDNNNNNFYPYGQSNRGLYKIRNLQNFNGRIAITTTDGIKFYDILTGLKIINNDNFRTIYNNTCRCGIRLYNSLHSIETGQIRVNNYTEIIGNFSPSQFNKRECLRNIFNENGLFISGTDYDIEFNLGDDVVVADWDNIDEMLKIKKIINFELFNPNMNETYIIDENNSINSINADKLFDVNNVKFNLSDENGNITSYLYIDFYSRQSLIHVPKIRKVITNYNDFSIGDVVKSKVPKIEGFPKKDFNEIIAFINDTGCEYPLALMSNTWTIRCNDLEEYFYKVRPEENELSPRRPAKVNTFTGDCHIFEPNRGTRYKLCVYKRVKIYIHNSLSHGIRNSDLSKKPFGFLNPKFDSLFKDQIENNLDDYFPNFRNWYVKINEGE